MIARPPRLGAELSPRLRAIAEHASVRFEEPDEWTPSWPVIRPATVVRFAIVAALVLGAVALRIVFDARRTQATTPSIHSVRSTEFLAMARECEQEARELRTLAATGKPGTLEPGGLSYSPRLALIRAKTKDQRAAGFRKLAQQEMRKELGLPDP